MLFRASSAVVGWRPSIMALPALLRPHSAPLPPHGLASFFLRSYVPWLSPIPRWNYLLRNEVRFASLSQGKQFYSESPIQLLLASSEVPTEPIQQAAHQKSKLNKAPNKQPNQKPESSSSKEAEARARDKKRDTKEAYEERKEKSRSPPRRASANQGSKRERKPQEAKRGAVPVGRRAEWLTRQKAKRRQSEDTDEVVIDWTGERREPASDRDRKRAGAASAKGGGKRVSPISAAAAASGTLPSEESAGEAQSPESRQAEGFAVFGFHAALLERLATFGIATPTEIQARALEEVLRGNDVLACAETGSGKTFVYLLPALQLIRRRREAAQEAGAPLVLVLVPSQELVRQVAGWAARLDPQLRLASAGLVLPPPPRLGPPELLIATPGALASADVERLSSTLELVCVDEADLLLGGSFARPMNALLKALRESETCPGTRQYVFVAATVPVTGRKTVFDWFQRKYRRLFGRTVYVSSAGLHRPLATLEQHFEELPGPANSPQRLDRICDELAGLAAGQRALVFANSTRTVQTLAQALVARGVAVRALHRDLSSAERDEALTALQRGEARALVCTDLASRGLDFARGVDLVLNAEFPRDAVAYLHRAGRTARAGRPGRLVSFVSSEDTPLARSERHLAQAIQRQQRANQSLPFSHRRSFRRRIRKLEKAAHPKLP